MVLKKKTIFIDALPIVPQRMSGVGHNALELIKALDRLSVKGEDYRLCLIVPLWKKKALSRHNFSNRISLKVIPLPARAVDLLLRLHLMPPIDLFFGAGDYLFLNYRNWPLARSKSYTFIHDAVFMRYPEYVQPRNLAYLKKYSRLWIRRADKVLTLSEFSKKELMYYFNLPARKITIVSCGIDPAIFYERDKIEIEEIRNKYHLPNRPYLLYLGNIEPRKNLKRLIEAFDAMPPEIKEKYALLLVGGDGWLNQDIYSQIESAQKNGGTIYKPNKYVEDADIPALISGASILIHPAIYEGFGLSPLQAMACGTPVIAADTSSLPEVVGNAGLLVDPANKKNLSDMILRVLSDSATSGSMKKKGLERAKKFTWSKSAQELLNCISDKPTNEKT